MSEANESKPNQGSFDGIEYILGTPLEWSWLEEKLCASLQTKAKFGSDHTAQQIGLGQGSLSVLARIQPMWTQSDERLPRSVIAKIASLKTMREMVNGPLASAQTFLDFNMKEALNSMEKFINSIHNTEASLYAALQTSGLNLKVPKAYVLQKCDIHCPQGVIVMEDMGEDAFTVPLYDVISVENVYEIMDQLAELHKFSYENSDWISSIGTSTILSLMRTEDGKTPFLAMIKSMRYLDESLAPMVDRIVDNWDTIFDENTLTKLHNVIGIPPVIVHGDLWNANLIWKKHNGKRTLAAIIDWQMAHPGCAAEDIARIICCALTSKDRREHWRDILEYYYRKLGEKMRKEPPLSFNQLEESFIRVYPLTMCIISSAFGPLMRLDIQMKCPDRVDELTAAMHEKACHLLEDGLNYYSKNAEKNA